MPKVKITTATTLKLLLRSAQELSVSQKVMVPKNSVLEATEIVHDRNQHLLLQLAVPILAEDGKTKLASVYAYEPHVSAEVSSLKLDVPYASQLGNEEISRNGEIWYDWRQCNTTSNTMLANFLLKGELTKKAKAQGLPEPESIYMRTVAKYGDTIDHDAQTQALRSLGIESYFSYTLGATDVLRSLKANIPVIAGFAYKDAGHICLIVGYEPAKKVWLVHDPYGTRHGASDNYDIGAGGAFDPYTNDTMQRVFWDQGGEAGWGRIVTSVKGKPTGLPSGL